VEKFCRAGHDTVDNMAHAHCLLDNLGYNTQTDCAILIAIPLQQWLHLRPSMLRYT